MKKYLIILLLVLCPVQSRADLWGGDLPLLAQIVSNTLMTLNQLRTQTRMMEDEMDGIRDRIDRITTIANMVQPSTWDRWKDPQEALRRLQLIYYTLPKEYRSERSDEIEAEISKALNLIARLTPETRTTFASGKELERRGADASPGVAQKLTASGIGTLIAMEAQSQALQSQITSLLAQTLAQGNERESRSIVSRGTSFNALSKSLSPTDPKQFKFSDLVLFNGGSRL